MASSRPGQAASLLFYFSVLLVAASSVAFGLDWMRAPLPPMPETEASVQAAKLAAHLPPPRAVTVIAKAAPRSVYPAAPAADGGRAVAAVDATAQGQQGAATSPSIMAPEPTAAQTPADQPKCDVAACSAAYHSFRASDCSWQPFDGPRRFCDKGQPPQTEAALPPDATADATPVSTLCDVEACKQAYFTFTPADCTYQPSNGPRRICERGTPPKPQAATQPAAAPAAASGTQAPPKCDVEACRQAYFTFNPTDCTYQPSNGPRRFCDKGTPPQPVADTAPAAAAPASSDAQPAAAVAPAAAPPPTPATAPAAAAAPAGEQAKQEAVAPAPPPAAAVPVASNKCDVAACKQAYFSFNPADCTYQPSSGPRRLCDKGAPPKPQAAAPAPAPTHPVPPGLVPSPAR